VEPLPVLLGRHAGGEFEPLRLVGVRPAMVLLEHVHNVHPVFDGLVGRPVARAAIGEGVHHHIVVSEDLPHAPARHIAGMEHDLLAPDPLFRPLERIRRPGDEAHGLYTVLPHQIPGHRRSDLPCSPEDEDLHARSHPLYGSHTSR